MQIVYKNIWEHKFPGFKVLVDKVYHVGWTHEFDQMSDAVMKKSQFTGNMLITLVSFDEEPVVTRELSQKDAHDYCVNMLHDDHPLFWYAKDALLDNLW